MADVPPAVFLSYASQDAEAAQRIAEKLRSAGVEVWFDQDELRGGDAWDAKIRRQIQECSLFLPLVSAKTQARPEGYFRFEWKLAVDRSHLMADDHPFLFPVVIDDTPDAVARVPDRFRERQWARLPVGQADEIFIRQVQRLLERGSVAGHPGSSVPWTPTRTGKLPVRWWPWFAALVFALAAGSWFVVRPSSPALPPEVALGSKAIAVLPFTNMSERNDNAYFADGVQEDILTSLALIGDMEVISRTSVMGYRDTKKPLQQIGRELGVAFILEGSVRRIGNKVRVTGQLINARTDQHLWAKAYDRELDDIFAIQAALAKEIAAALHAVLTPQEVARLESRPTDNVEAYNLYLEARAGWGSGQGTPEMLAQMQPRLERAVQLDPHFGLAWLELANVHWRMYDYLDHTDARFVQAKTALDTAVRLAPDALDVIVGQTGYLQAAGDQVGAAAQRARLVRLYPSHPSTLLALAHEAHDPRQKLEYFQRARRLDPRNPELLDNMSGLFLGGRHYDEALALAAEAGALSPVSTLRAAQVALIPFLARGATGPMEACLAQIPPEARRTDPNAIMAQAGWAYTTGDAAGLVRLWEASGGHWRFAPETGRFDTIVVAQALIVLGQRERARPLLEKNRDQLAAALVSDPGNYRKWADLALIQAMLGNKPDAALAEGKARRLASWMSFAMFLAWSGDKAAALDELARTVPGSGNYHEANVHVLRHQIGLWPLQGDPRFEAILNDPRNNAPLF
jgi:TolB-like protein/Tfp pilus assembly protein PilF